MLAFKSGFGDEGTCTGNNTISLYVDYLQIEMTIFNRENCVKMIYNATNVYPPAGSSFYYGSDHLNIAALMAIKASGVTLWGELFNTYMKNPLGLGTTTGFATPSNPNAAGGKTTLNKIKN